MTSLRSISRVGCMVHRSSAVAKRGSASQHGGSCSFLFPNLSRNVSSRCVCRPRVFVRSTHDVKYRRSPNSSRMECRKFSVVSSQNNDNKDYEETSSTAEALRSMSNLSARMQRRIQNMKARHDEVLKLLRDGGDPTTLGKELSALSNLSGLCNEACLINVERTSLLDLLKDTEESINNGEEEGIGLRTEIDDELAQLASQLDSLSNRMIHSLVPMLNPDDISDLTSADAVIDIRAGTGGDEAALFASEILAGYEAIAKAGGGSGDEISGGGGGKSWDVEVLSVSRTDLGGVKEASLAVTSRGGGGSNGGRYDLDSTDADDEEGKTHKLFQQLGPYGFFQYESGVHRVQRVPVNDNKLQTSAVSVAVLPSIPESQIAEALPLSELKIETMRASGAGGQHVNTTESAVRVTHIPTGIMAYMQEERSQHKNKAKALKLVAARVGSLRKEQALKNRSSARSSLMGIGDRSERIRTYNFPQDRITDHRCKVTVTGVQAWLGAGVVVRKFGPRLYEMEREERAIALEEEGGETEAEGNKNRGHVKGNRKLK